MYQKLDQNRNLCYLAACTCLSLKTFRQTRGDIHTHTHIMEKKLLRFHLKRPPKLISQPWFRSRCRRGEERSRGTTVRRSCRAPDSFVRSLRRENGSIPTEMRNDPHLSFSGLFLMGCNETGLAESENQERPVTFSKAGRNWFHWSSRAEWKASDWDLTKWEMGPLSTAVPL